MIYLHYAVAAFALAVGVADWWTTQRILDQGGSELNPVMRLAMKLGRWWIVPKLALHLAIAMAVVVMQHGVVSVVAALAMLANAVVVYRNFVQIRPDEPT